jgi:peroxiredoxin
VFFVREEMKTAKLQKKRRNSDLPAAMLGGGLIILSVVFLVFFLRNGNDGPISETDPRNSVIPVPVNFVAPELSLENVNGHAESLSDFLGQVTLVNNWATWCPPCKAEMPTLVKFYDAHHGQGLVIVAIEAGEPKEQVLQFVEAYEMPFNVWLDPDGKALSAFKNPNLPSSYVLDRDGVVRYAWTGEINREMLEKYIAPLLNE